MSISLPFPLFKLPVFVLHSHKGHPDALEAAGRQKIRPVRAGISTRSDAGNGTIGRNRPGATSFLRRQHPDCFHSDVSYCSSSIRATRRAALDLAGELSEKIREAETEYKKIDRELL